MLKSIINEFRQQNGLPTVAMGNFDEDHNCLWHCKHMAEVQDCRHAPGHLRQGKAEAVAVRSFFRDHYDALRAIVFDQFAGSIGHRDILLFSENLACAFHVDHNYNCVFVTVRGW